MPFPPPDNQNKAPVKIESLSLTGLLVLAILYTSYFARSVLLPLAMALFLAFLLRPLVRLFKQMHIPEIVSSALLLLILLAVLGYGISMLSDPARRWVERGPQTLHQVGQKLDGIIRPVRKASKTAEELKKIAGPEKEKQVIVASGPSLTQTIMSGAREFLAQGTIMLILLFFILASGDLFLDKIKKTYATEEGKKRIAEIVKEVEHSISRYLLTVTIINAAEGVVVGLGLYLIGMPDPVLWGVMAGLLIYIPYLGPLVGISIVTIVALLTLEPEMAVLAPIMYLSVEILQGQVVTPLILGARFAMNPVAIFISLIIGGAIWGVIGAIMAVPLLTIMKILGDRITPLNPVSHFLSD